MKKIFSLLLAVLMVFALCSCGNVFNSASQPSESDNLLESEKMINSAERLNKKSLITEMETNLENTQEKRNGSIVKLVDMVVTDIHDDYITIRTGYKINTYGTSILRIDTYLSKEDIAKVKKNDIISVVGVIEILSSRDAQLNDAILLEPEPITEQVETSEEK